MPPNNPAEQHPELPARVPPASLEAVPPLPWSPQLEKHLYREPFWIFFVFGVALSVVDLIRSDDIGLGGWLSGPGTLFVLWTTLKMASERLTVREDGLVVTGPLLRRRYSWKAVEGVSRRGGEKVILDLGHRGSQTFKYGGSDNRPSADHVAGVVERLRGYNTSALTSYRVSLSWGAAVFLPAAAAVVAATAWALFKG